MNSDGRNMGGSIWDNTPGSVQEESDSAYDRLEFCLSEISDMAARVRQWPSPPSDLIAGAWAPLLHEKLRRVETILRECRDRLLPPKASPDQQATVSDIVGLPLADVEKRAILETLQLTHGNRERAASLLQIGSRTLYRKLKEYGVG